MTLPSLSALQLLLGLVCITCGDCADKPAARSCLSQHELSSMDAFGVSVITVPDGPSIVALDKRVCVTESPALWVLYSGERINLLNMTSSDAQCRKVYSTFVCPAQHAYASGVTCHHANLVSYAAMQQMPMCESDRDCEQVSAEIDLGLIYCPWAATIHEAVCPHAPRAPCSAVRGDGFALDGKACALTNSLCSSLVHNTILIASLAGVAYFMLLCAVIFCCSRYEEAGVTPCVVVYPDQSSPPADTRAARKLFDSM